MNIMLKLVGNPSSNIRACSYECVRMYHQTAATFFGRPFKHRNIRQVLHGAQRPAQPSNIDFSALGLKYEMTHPTDVVIQKRVWSPKPATSTSHLLPFQVERTEVGDGLPVYTAYKGGNTKVVTIIRKCKGDIQELKNEVEKIVGKSVELHPGKIGVSGNFHRRLKIWLLGLGF